jgi:hypothetical protein
MAWYIAASRSVSSSREAASTKTSQELKKQKKKPLNANAKAALILFQPPFQEKEILSQLLGIVSAIFFFVEPSLHVLSIKYNMFRKCQIVLYVTTFISSLIMQLC